MCVSVRLYTLCNRTGEAGRLAIKEYEGTGEIRDGVRLTLGKYEGMTEIEEEEKETIRKSGKDKGRNRRNKV